MGGSKKKNLETGRTELVKYIPKHQACHKKKKALIVSFWSLSGSPVDGQGEHWKRSNMPRLAAVQSIVCEIFLVFYRNYRLNVECSKEVGTGAKKIIKDARERRFWK